MQAIIDLPSQSLIDTLDLDNGSQLSFELVFVKGGTFMMGSENEDAHDDEKLVHKVSIKDFYMGRYLVNQQLWMAVMEKNSSFYQDLFHPVERISWEDCQEFLNRLGEKTALPYRLPSEAEWEYAARGGKGSFDTKFAGSPALKEVGWYYENSGLQTHLPALRRGNELGICDMSGNVYEWCEDRWHHDYKEAPDDGSAWTEGEDAARVLRGGSWGDHSQNCRVSNRFSYHPRFRVNFIGFRLALSPESVG